MKKLKKIKKKYTKTLYKVNRMCYNKGVKIKRRYEMADKIINFRVDETVAEKLKAKSKKLGLSCSGYLRMLILKDK